MKGLSFVFTAIVIGGVIFAGCTKKIVASKILEEELKMPPKEAVVWPVAEDLKARPLEEKIVKPEVAPIPEIKGLQDIFFDYDRFYIRDDAIPVLKANAEYLKVNRDISILIEGHCDERGTSEYNIALGERRAQATKRYLVDLGIDPSRISTISYGKERPFCTTHNEGCWQENRRAHFVVK